MLKGGRCYEDFRRLRLGLLRWENSQLRVPVCALANCCCKLLPVETRAEVLLVQVQMCSLPGDVAHPDSAPDNRMQNCCRGLVLPELQSSKAFQAFEFRCRCESSFADAFARPPPLAHASMPCAVVAADGTARIARPGAW